MSIFDYVELRNLTEVERERLNELLAPYFAERQEAERLIAAVGGAFLAALGFPTGVRVNLDTGVVTQNILAGSSSSNGMAETAEAGADRG